MAKSHYSADSAPLPQPSLPSNDGKIGPFETLNVLALFPRQPVPAAAVFLLTDAGENANFDRRLPERIAVRRKADQSSSPAPISID